MKQHYWAGGRQIGTPTKLPFSAPARCQTTCSRRVRRPAGTHSNLGSPNPSRRLARPSARSPARILFLAVPRQDPRLFSAAPAACSRHGLVGLQGSRRWLRTYQLSFSEFDQAPTVGTFFLFNDSDCGSAKWLQADSRSTLYFGASDEP